MSLFGNLHFAGSLRIAMKRWNWLLCYSCLFLVWLHGANRAINFLTKIAAWVHSVLEL